ncbi:lipopolysaccharide biosynthesis protein [Arcobacter nitrofigilis DSM 7299]|uniref:Lipopolysaccharide biosynthesis protein n=1 Tax=Arcobacter nitrofigilis (strain ATCC 33309 / DSM 7299 / CCUG 15893 / LMG 7604 / NCTC 12251 / CI) TaxID=572480 RepID=D5V6F3_ARCNC|nr:Wzz/FepE/Etk N-terminal domain-containing protein [Arcobacter nitrofigilis]ADG94223.1 lipopolysaccharide biosynthesis protein [Arcobacter nitrofigilis DSM 7299]
MVQNNQLQEDEIDLRELFLTIWSHKKFIIIFTLIVTIGAVIYAYTKTPIYEVKGVIEVGSFSNSNSNNNNNNNNNYIENPKSLIKKLEIINIDNVEKNQKEIISSVILVKSTPNLIEITSQSKSNTDATNLLDKIIKKLIDEHKVLINNYKSLIMGNINNLKSQNELLEKNENKFDGRLALKFELISKIKDLEFSISSYNIQDTKQIGKDITNQIIPKKKLIVIAAFVSGFILSIFLIFFIEFIKGIKKEEKIK